MPREVYVYDPMTGRMIPKAEMLARKANMEPDLRNPNLACPQVIHDTMRPVQSMTNGKLYDSKHELRKEYKRAGVVEVGNDPAYTAPKPFQKPRPKREEIRAAVERANSYVNLVS